MRQYLDMLQYIVDEGVTKEDRTGVGTKGVFGYQLRHDLSKGFPLLTTKRVYLRAVIHELLWFISGSTNIKYLQDNNVNIWDEWADEDGELGPVYGQQWRDFNGVDQLALTIEQIKQNPFSRRHIVSAWNPNEVPNMALPPCHLLYQFNVVPDAQGNPHKLDCQLYQRSCDVFLGVPFNIASYALLTQMVAQVTDLVPGNFIHTFGDLHIYSNHVDQVDTQLCRTPRELPRMLLNQAVTNIDDFKFEDFKLEGYDPYPPIKAPIAV